MRELKSETELSSFLSTESHAVVRIGAAWDRAYDTKLEAAMNPLEADLGLAIAFASIDVECCENFADRIGLLNVPAMVFVVSGTVVAVEIGVRSPDAIRTLALKWLFGRTRLQ